jgi:hypothetical protein
VRAERDTIYPYSLEENSVWRLTKYLDKLRRSTVKLRWVNLAPIQIEIDSIVQLRSKTFLVPTSHISVFL